jgi:hypothetical protein
MGRADGSIPDFITKEEEAFLTERVRIITMFIYISMELIGQIKDSPKPKWKTVGSGRR